MARKAVPVSGMYMKETRETVSDERRTRQGERCGPRKEEGSNISSNISLQRLVCKEDKDPPPPGDSAPRGGEVGSPRTEGGVVSLLTVLLTGAATVNTVT